ncbi:hypothetical protein QE381_002109 [Microbacterium sp. SORGH_AS 888]|nr:hypothetical protein [Microbacterium sp. SORGH_AS_0888]
MNAARARLVASAEAVEVPELPDVEIMRLTISGGMARLACPFRVTSRGVRP